MNEFVRQSYLSAFGVDNYMPRWQLPAAALSVACNLSIQTEVSCDDDPRIRLAENTTDYAEFAPASNQEQKAISSINQLISDVFVDSHSSNKRLAASSVNRSSALVSAEVSSVTPFSLTVWRPVEGVLIVDSRDTALALPTDLFLHNILRAVFDPTISKVPEEVLRWPMIENKFAVQTEENTRNELQTWLSVQNEIRPISSLWLMGEVASKYLIERDVVRDQVLFNVQAVESSTIKALILPSLNELLIQPHRKKQMLSSIQRYQSAQ